MNIRGTWGVFPYDRIDYGEDSRPPQPPTPTGPDRVDKVRRLVAEARAAEAQRRIYQLEDEVAALTARITGPDTPPAPQPPPPADRSTWTLAAPVDAGFTITHWRGTGWRRQ